VGIETELRTLGWSETDAKAIAALPVEVRYFDVGDDVPVTITARWTPGEYGDHPIGAEVRAWAGSRSWPYPVGEALGFIKPSTPISRAEFDELRRRLVAV
jgi:hypothetical protein